MKIRNESDKQNENGNANGNENDNDNNIRFFTTLFMNKNCEDCFTPKNGLLFG